MPGNSLVRYAASRRVSAGKRLHWGRVDEDGLPFRGHFAPIMPDEEYEARAVRVADFRNAFFDVTDPHQNRQFQDILECCMNGWFCLYHIDRFWRETTKHYVEWVEFYMEDGTTRTPYATTRGVMEVASGANQSFSIPG